MTTRYFRRFALDNLDEVPAGAKVHLGFGIDYLVGTVEVPPPSSEVPCGADSENCACSVNDGAGP